MGSAVQWSDLHCPHEDLEAVDSVLRFTKEWKPTHHIFIGDCLNLSGISRHVQDDLVEQYEEPVEVGLQHFGQLIDEVVRASPDAQIIWIWGNHDERLRSFVRKNPAWRKILDKPLKLLQAFGNCENAHRVRLVQFKDPEQHFKIGRMSFVHGHYTGKHVAAQHVEAYGESVTFGHSHTMQQFTAVRKGQPVGGYCIGHLMSKSGRQYLKGRPHRWVTGFAFMEWNDSTGMYTQHLLPIVKGEFRFAGRTYKGRKK
jgi:predicted phosphodiesterase